MHVLQNSERRRRNTPSLLILTIKTPLHRTVNLLAQFLASEHLSHPATLLEVGARVVVVEQKSC